MSDDNPGRRRFARILFDAACELKQDDRIWHAQVMDISLKGVLLTHPACWDGDQEEPFAVTIYLSDNETTIEMMVKLKHSTDNHLGFVCQSLDLDSATHLRRLVELNLGDEALMQRELHALIEQ